MLGYHEPGQDSCLSGCGHRVDSVGYHEYAGAVIGRLIDEYQRRCAKGRSRDI